MFAPFLLIILGSIFNFFLVHNLVEKLLPIFEKNYLDFPNDRSIHISPKPTGGALIIVISSLITYFLLSLLINKIPYFESLVVNNINKIIILCLPISFIGFIDDLYEIKYKIKLGIQILTAILFINYIDIFIFQTQNNLVFFIQYFSLIIFISGVINVINFMDGIDGLICGTFSFIYLILSIKQNILYLPLSLGLLSFLKWNWYPSRIFMGDTGSTFLGATYAVIIISSKSLQEALSILLLISPLLIDSISCIFRRLIVGHNIFKAHKLHLYQRLVQNRFTHDNVSIIYLSGCLLTSIFYLSNKFLFEIISVLIIIAIGIYLEKKHATPFPKN